MRITFVGAVMSAGLGQPSIMADGKLHRFKCARCAADGKRDNRHAWYVFHDDGIPAGAFGCWRCTEKQTWCEKPDTGMSPSERARLAELTRDAVRQRDEEQVREHNAAALLAARIYRVSDRPATGHPYLLSKGVNEPPRVRSIMPADLRNVSAETSATLTGQGLTGRLLVVPMFDENGSQTSTQFIGENGKRSFLAGGRVRGCSFTIGGEDSSIVICEGLATAQTLFEATRATIITAFSAGNLEAVARSIFKKMPKAEILVAADNDLETEGNPGVTKGRAAASAINAWLAVPQFDEGATGSDFNDLAQAKGLDEVRRQVDAAMRANDPTPAPETTRDASDAPGLPGYSLGLAKEPTAPTTEPLPGGKTEADEPVILRLADVQPEAVSWLWQSRIPLGKLTILDGDPGTGKSMLSLDLAARVSTGALMPDGTLGHTGGAVFLCAEDDPSDTVKPRFTAAGGDPARVVLLRGLRAPNGDVRPPTVHHVEAIARACDEVKAAFVVIDPLMAHLGGADSHKDADVRAALTRLVELGQERRLSVLAIRHLNKLGGGSPIYRGGGSIGIIAAARSALLAGRDPDDPDGPRRILTVTKSNLAAMPKAISYSIRATDGVARIEWGGETDHKPTDLLHGDDVEQRTEIGEAVEFLQEMLQGGSETQGDIIKAARAAGISERTLRRAKSKLHVHSHRTGGPKSPWYWSLENPFGPGEGEGQIPLGGQT